MLLILPRIHPDPIHFEPANVTFNYYFLSWMADCGSVSSSSQSQTPTPSLPIQKFQALSKMSQTLLIRGKNSLATNNSRYNPLDTDEFKTGLSSCPCNSDIVCSPSQASNLETMPKDNQSWTYDQASTPDVVAADHSSNESQVLYPDSFCSGEVSLFLLSFW